MVKINLQSGEDRYVAHAPLVHMDRRGGNWCVVLLSLLDVYPGTVRRRSHTLRSGVRHCAAVHWVHIYLGSGLSTSPASLCAHARAHCADAYHDLYRSP